MKEVHDGYQKPVYVLLDPFSQKNSGVSAYNIIAYERLAKLNVEVMLIKRQENESLEIFRWRIYDELKKIFFNVLCVEAPESLASTLHVPDNIPLHIRLHCSRSLGAALQRQIYHEDDVRMEQREIDRAKFVSSPSWAGYFASKRIFSLKNNILFYPNPCPTAVSLNVEPVYDFLFIGRFQKFKGIEFLEKIIKYLPNYSFLIATDLSDEKKRAFGKNVTFCDGLAVDKQKIYSLAKIVIIPSLFETSSMVLLESIANKRKVVTWEHIGAVEYFDEFRSNITVVEPFDVKKFSKALRFTISDFAFKEDGAINSINLKFDFGLKRIIDNDLSSCEMIKRIKPDTINFIEGLNRVNHMQNVKKNSLFKKTRKLFRSPQAFFNDSKIFNKKLKSNLLEISHANTNSNPKIINESVLKIEKDIIVSATPSVNFNDKALPEITLEPKESYYCVISDEGRIEFPEPRKKPEGHTVAFLYPFDDHFKDADKIIEGLQSFSDFKYVSLERMHIGRYNLSAQESALSLINRIDLKNKNNFSLINFVILLNAPANLCKCLRSIGTSQRIVYISTEELIDDLHNDVDVLLKVGSIHNDSKNKYRRYIEVDDLELIPLSIRKILQEGFPKKPDMLFNLSCQDEVFTRDDFQQFDYEAFDGIIKVRKGLYKEFTSMDELYNVFSERIVGLALKESIYNKYKNLCEDVQFGCSSEHLIKLCLSDGALFDVKEV